MLTYAARRLPLLPLVAGLAACGSGSANPIKAAMAQRRASPPSAQSVVFRLATERGGDVRLYLLPQLQEATWRFRTPGLAAKRLIGFSKDHDEIYLLNARGDLEGLDLGTGRARVVDSNVVASALGPMGVLHLVRGDGSVAAVSYRAVTPWAAQLDPLPQAVWGGEAEQLVALVQDQRERRLVTLAAGRSPITQPIPDGPLAVSVWGDLAAVAVDSGVLVLDPLEPARRRFTRLPAPTAVAFSPSEHRLYVADADGDLQALERYSLARQEEVRLPGRARAIRPDPLGRLLLIRPQSGDSVWLVDPWQQEVLGTVPSTWREDLPAVAPDGTLLTLRGEDLLALTLDSLTARGRVDGGARDQWLTAAWDPRRPALQLATDSSAQTAAPATGQFYVQVSSTANESWAQDLARNLRTAGMQASVLPPSNQEDRYRVVLGPYPTRETAEATGRKLGRPFWIFTGEGQDTPR